MMTEKIIDVYNDYLPYYKMAKEIEQNCRYSFSDFINFCTSHKAAVKRYKKRGRR